jgi:antitoxin PrlF
MSNQHNRSCPESEFAIFTDDDTVAIRANFGMGHEFSIARVAENGRLSIPAKQRRALGLEHGGLVVLEIEDGELRVRPVEEVVAALRAMVRHDVRNREGASDRLLALRREEVAREDAERSHE